MLAISDCVTKAVDKGLLAVAVPRRVLVSPSVPHDFEHDLWDSHGMCRWARRGTKATAIRIGNVAPMVCGIDISFHPNMMGR